MTPAERLQKFAQRILKLQHEDVEHILDLQQEAVLWERDRIRRLAEAVDAYYTVTTQIVGGGWDVQERKFAEVITSTETKE